MGLNIGLRMSLKRGPHITKSYSKGRVLLWLRKGKLKGSIRKK